MQGRNLRHHNFAPSPASPFPPANPIPVNPFPSIGPTPVSKSSSPLKCHPLSSPPLMKLQSPFITQSQPPPTPLPPLHSGISSADGCGGGVWMAGESRRLKVDTPHVNGLKSSVEMSSGMLPVRARPIAMMGAAWEHINIAYSSSSSPS